MKQKKWMTWLLGVLVIGIWGIIMQRIFNSIGDAEEVQFKQEVRTGGRERLPKLQPDTFKLKLNYPDPFTGEVKADQVVTGLKPAGLKSAVGAPVIATPHVAAPDPTDNMTYLGYVLNPESKKRVAILNFSGKELMMSAGERSGELQLMSISTTAISIKYKNKVKQIKSKL